MKQVLSRLAIYTFLTICIFAVYRVYEPAPGETLPAILAFHLGFYAPLAAVWFAVFEGVYQVVKYARKPR